MSYPEVSADEIFRAVETFYRRYYFSRRYIWKSIKKMARDREEAKRLLSEGRQFLGVDVEAPPDRRRAGRRTSTTGSD